MDEGHDEESFRRVGVTLIALHGLQANGAKTPHRNEPRLRLTGLWRKFVPLARHERFHFGVTPLSMA